MAVPIWKDQYIDLGQPSQSGGAVPFYIYCAAKSAVIFQGSAFPKPGATSAVIRINDICADYLHSYFLEQASPTMPAKTTFTVYSTATGSAVLKGTVEFYNDWSYDPQYNPASDGMNFPPVLTFGPKQFIPVTVWSGYPGAATIYLASGTTASATPTKSYISQLSEMLYFADTYVLPMSLYANAVKVVMGGKTYIASKTCPRFALYYLNAYGGWDALPVEGTAIQGDAVTHHESELVYDNNISSARGKENYINELKHTYKLHTGGMTNAQSARMHHLLTSPSVYLHDTESDMVLPVNITSTVNEYKERRGGMVSYTIEAELAQSRIRR